MFKKIFLLTLLTFFTSFAAYTSILFPIPPDMYQLVSTIALILFALPSFYFLIKSIGIKKGILAIIVLFLFALTFEYFAIKTGFPYGHFTYTNKIGFLLLDTVPIFVGFAWTPLIIGSLFLARRISQNPIVILALSTVFLLLSDLILDPGAVALGYWTYSGASFLYAVPLSNFLGWIISGFIGSYLLASLLPSKQNTCSPWILLSLYLIVIYWTTITITFQLWISGIIGVCFILSLLIFFFIKTPKQDV